jgi:hypothetical protein
VKNLKGQRAKSTHKLNGYEEELKFGGGKNKEIKQRAKSTHKLNEWEEELRFEEFKNKQIKKKKQKVII